MECREIDLEATPAVDEEEEAGLMVACEMEAAEALAGLSRCRNLGSSDLRRIPAADADQPEVRRKFPEKTEKIVKKIPSQLCSTSSMGKLRLKPTEAEKEDRKLRRIMANRESARQTIRRRKEMHLELTRKAANVLEENEILKKEKELVVDQYNSLKDKNEFLKAQLAKIKKAEMQEKCVASSSENPCPATTNTPNFLHNQPSILPCFWPPILPSSESFQFQCALGANNVSSLQYPMPGLGLPFSHQGQENSTQGTPLFVVALPWLLPFVTHGSTVDFHSGSNESPQNARPSLMCEDNNQLSSSQNMNAGASNSTRTKSLGAQHLVSHPVDNSSGACIGSTDESMEHGLFDKNREPAIRAPKNAEDAFIATVARRRRKELMRLKNIHCQYDHLHYSASG